MSDWFKLWFDSPYYHILYKYRNDAEAKTFLDNILSFLKLPAGCKILDQACGKGRHARYLNKLGYDVTGTDLSEKSISYCKQFENETLHFHVHDMRTVLRENYFDCVFNVFTSLGYFNCDDEQQLAVDSAAAALKQDGWFVVDFLNAKKVIKELVPSETVIRDKIAFQINRKFENGFINKKISFSDHEKNFEFEENVEAISLNDFERYFEHAGLKMVNIFGSYNLDTFDETNSERLILIVRK